MADQHSRTHVDTVPTDGAAHACRICHRVLGSPGDLLMEPCACRGPNGFVHKSCLERWLRERDTLECDVCHKPFMVLFKNAPLLDFFKDPDHRVDVLRMVVDAVSAAGDALVLSFAWAYVSAILGATGWTLYLLILFVMMFQTAFWSGVEVIRVLYVRYLAIYCVPRGGGQNFL
ncbi:E3 ubiquitin-protein ligase MARCHF2-like [Rhipicephalus microplus]|uniref:E3 ubiquitin-protein ligase MARCHF2-like n=1 Tax=Rhipicephalus microplus TaxID=6941 RepID=UPI003F6B9DCD